MVMQQQLKDSHKAMLLERKSRQELSYSITQLRSSYSMLEERLICAGQKGNLDAERIEELQLETAEAKAKFDRQSDKLNEMKEKNNQLMKSLASTENAYAETKKQQQKWKEKAQELEQMNFSAVMESNLQLANQFQSFLEKHNKQ